MLEVIYVVRHGYRSNWSVNPTTGTYASPVRTPTGIPSDPALASYGVLQAKQLATHLLALNPSPDKLFSSPYYRCLQTLEPFVTQRADKDPATMVTIEQGLGEFYGQAPFEHPTPAGLEELAKHFDHLRSEAEPIVIPEVRGESIPALHDRVAFCLATLISRADADPAGPKAILVCSHAAAIIAMGRVLTGRMPEDVGEEDFRCFTCGVSEYRRKGSGEGGQEEKWRLGEEIPDVGWREGRGGRGGWECVRNSDCSFLDGGEERGWNFHMEQQRLQRLADEAAAKLYGPTSESVDKTLSASPDEAEGNEDTGKERI